MRRLRLLALTSLGVFAACSPPDRALRVSVTVRAQGTAKVRADCLKLVVFDDASAELKSLIVPRPADDTAVFAVRRGTDLPGTVKLRVDGYLGTCTDEATLKLNAQSTVETGVFPESGFTVVELTVDPPGPSLDGDRDGFVAGTKGGPDCRDDDGTIFPGAGQVCANKADTDCDGQGGCDDSECNTATVCADPPDRVAVTAAFSTMLRHECRPVRVELRNATGSRVAVRDTTVTLASSLAGTTLHVDANCRETPVTSVPIAYGSSSFEFYLRADATAFGPTTLTATATQVAMPGTLTIDVQPQPVDHIVFTSPARTQTAGLCGAEPVGLEFRDAMDRRTDVSSDTTVQLSATPGDLNNANIFFSDAACATDGSAPMLRAGQGALTVYVLAKRATTFTLRAAPSVGTAATQPLTVTPGSATKLAFLNQPLALVTTQTCSAGSLDVRLQDQFDNPTTASTDVTVRLSVMGLSQVSFFEYADATCATAKTDFVVPAATGLVRVRAAAASAASGNMGTVRAAPVSAVTIADATQDLFVAAGPPNRFTWDGTAQSPLAGVCSANPLTLRITDATGNTTSSSTPITFTLGTAPGADPSFGFFSNAGCVTALTGNQLTIPANQTSAQVYFRGNRVIASFEVTASASGLSGPSTRATGNSIRPNVPAKLVFISPTSQSAQAGTCSPSAFQAEVRDQYDNVTSFTTAQTVSVASSPPGVTVGMAPTCDTASAVTLPANTSVATFNARHTLTNTYALTATVNGFSTVPAASFTVTPGPATLQVDTPVGTATLNAGGCQAVTLSRRDSIGPNNAPLSGTNPVTLAFPPGTTWLTYTSSNCTTGQGAAISINNSHTVTFSVSPQRATGPLAMSATVAGQTATVNFLVAPGAPTLVFEAPDSGTPSAAAAQTAGGCTRVAVNRRDPFLNDVPTGMDGGIAISMVAGTTAHAESTCDAGSALTFVPVAATDSRGQFWVRATTSAPSGGPQAQTVGVTLAAQTANLTLTVSPAAPTLRVADPAGATASISANTCVPVTIERRDAFNNLVPISAGMNIALAAVSGAIYEGFTSNNCTGTATNTIPMTGGTSSRLFSVRSTRAGTQTINLTLDGQTVPLTLNVSPGPLNKFVVESLPTPLTARDCQSGLRVRRQDQWNNDITADPATSVALSSTRYTFSTTAGCGGAASPLTITIPNGSAVSSDTVYVTGTVAGAATVNANTVPTSAVTGSATGSIVAGPAHHLSFTNAAGSVVSGACSGTLGVELRDQDENVIAPAVGAPVTVTLGSTNAVTFSSGGSCSGALPVQITNAQPSPSFSFRPTVAGPETITASASSFMQSQAWTVTAGSASKLLWRTPPTTPATTFACTAAGVLRAADANNNTTTVSSPVTVTPSPSLASRAGITFYSDAMCTSAVTTISINSGASETAPFFFVGTGNNMVQFSATGSAPISTAAPNVAVTVGGTQGALEVAPTAPDVEAGACVAITATRRVAAAGALVTTGTTELSFSVPGNVTLHADMACSGAGGSSLAATIGEGQSTATVWARGRSAAPAGSNPANVTLTVSDVNGGSTSATSTLKVYPLVRRGTITLTGTSQREALVPPLPNDDLSRSFLVFTSTGRPATSGPTAMAPADQNVECHLETTSGAGVTCTREGSNGSMTIAWQVVSFGRSAANGGVSVQHFPTVPTPMATTTQPITAVNTATSFILASNTMSGTANDGDGFPVVRFPSTGASVGSVEIVANTGTPTTRNVSFQVVTLGMTGAAVDHRTESPKLGAGFNITTNNTGVMTSFAFGMARVNDAMNQNVMCKRRFNLKLNAASVAFHRGGASAGTACTSDDALDVTVQRITIPGVAVRIPADVTLSNGTTATNASITNTTTHKAIAFLMMQGPGGQTAGEADFAVTQGDGDDTGPFHATVTFSSATQLTLTRAVPSNVGSVFTPMVVEFDP
ncbi:MAG: beta strand repeat-containing protein [Myxococcota bacterium]